MSVLKTPPPVKPVAAVFSAERDLIGQAVVRLEQLLGPIDYISEEMPFDQTDYYNEEMGGPLIKRFLSAETLVDSISLVDVKVGCAEMEKEFMKEGKRLVNLDPGYITIYNLVLFTGKPASHRIYLGRGVWTELTLIYQHGRFDLLPWTYPDYAVEPVRGVMADIRNKYLHQLKNIGQE